MAKKYVPSILAFISIYLRAKRMARLWSEMNDNAPVVAKYKGHTLYIKNNRFILDRKVSSGVVYVGGFCTEVKCIFPQLTCDKCMLNTKMR